jgi:aryl-alcohol dehydrogenase-like predicted oxidoreductase
MRGLEAGVEYAACADPGLMVSRIGFGCWAIGGHGYGPVDDETSIRAVRHALSRGITFFDTADVYGLGHSEEILSKALGERRQDVVIATKGGVGWDAGGRTFRDSTPQHLVAALEASLRRLRIECVPLYQVHHHDGVTPLEATMEALIRCRDAGKIRFIGASNLSLTQVGEMGNLERLFAIQSPFSVVNRTNEPLLRHCHERAGMITIAYGALVRGLLTGKYDGDAKFGADDTRSRDPDFHGARLDRNLAVAGDLACVAADCSRSVAQVALRWVLDQPFISTVIVSMKTPEQVQINVGAMGWTLTDDARQYLSRHSLPPANP